MSAGLWWNNLVAYSLQIGLVVGIAAAAPGLLRLRSPRGRLAYWQVLLAACLLLPAIRPWRKEVITETVSVTSTVIAIAPAPSRSAPAISLPAAGLAIVGLGALCRLMWLGVGFWRLRRYRRRSRPLETVKPWASRAELRIAEGVTSPVTFGARRPVVLLPQQWDSLDRRAQDAILRHELLHVERGDWLFTIGEELIRAIFWFHPAIWWLLGEIQLAREQSVDRQVIDMTAQRDEYVDALLAIAGTRMKPDLAPAPLFLRKRHLKHRVVSILKEVRMSKKRSFSALAASLCVLLATCWFVTNTFPLAAAPQVVNDAPGVTVDIGGATLLHRTAVGYPEATRSKGVQGVVILELTMDASGNVADARAVSGPEELRRPALQSALQWHFAHEAAGNKRQVTIAFQAPAPAAGERRPTPGESAAATFEKRIEAAGKAPMRDRTIKSIQIAGVSDAVRAELLAKLPVRVGSTVGFDQLAATSKAIAEFDEHLRLATVPAGDDQVGLVISPREATQLPEAGPTAVPGRIRVGGNVMQTKLRQQPRPVYPPEAKEARIQGAVQLLAVIGKDGTIQKLDVISGHPLLVPSALEAVRQWVYEPTLLNGNPVEVQTQIDVNYTLSQ